jgi:ABC-type nickel/cobalt efflux system permease component RcnA
MSSWLLMGSALALGVAHALEPGHGKTLLSVHFSGSKNRLRDALQIGLLITLLHAASITLYGAIGVGLAKTFFQSPEALVNAGSLMAGAVVLLLGGWWTWQAWATPPSCHHHEHHMEQFFTAIQPVISQQFGAMSVRYCCGGFHAHPGPNGAVNGRIHLFAGV